MVLAPRAPNRAHDLDRILRSLRRPHRPVGLLARHADGLAVLAVLVVSLASAAWFTRSFYYFQDDFIFIRQAQTSSLSLTYLRGPLFQHFSPVSRLARLRPRSLVSLQCRCRPHH